MIIAHLKSSYCCVMWLLFSVPVTNGFMCSWGMQIVQDWKAFYTVHNPLKLFTPLLRLFASTPCGKTINMNVIYSNSEALISDELKTMSYIPKLWLIEKMLMKERGVIICCSWWWNVLLFGMWPHTSFWLKFYILK